MQSREKGGGDVKERETEREGRVMLERREREREGGEKQKTVIFCKTLSQCYYYK